MKKIISERYKKALVTVAMGFRTEEDIKRNGLLIYSKESKKDLITYLKYLYSKKENILVSKVKKKGFRSVHVELKTKEALGNFIKDLESIYQEYSEIWVISSSIIECWRGRITLSNTCQTDMIELAYSNDDHILDKINSATTTPYACYKIEGLTTKLFKTNLAKVDLKELEIIINNILSKYSKQLKKVKQEMAILNVMEISLDVRINETYDFHDFDVSPNNTKKVIDYYFSVMKDKFDK